MSKIRFVIAGGHMRGEILGQIENNPQKSELENIRDWVERRYGGWITKHMSDASPWTFVSVDFETTDKGEKECVFYLDFENPNDEDAFIRNVGGKIIPSEVPDDE
ncbi:hypothetical protein [Rhizobium sp. L43]|uniref:hypothetical protein n=1 Tax=Rhizobium sp. L43 TaxID=2035452 RepID=UPI000BEAB957|nr:hypothetical protein [Rhizobium sp. L43]PDS75446.1 hypothetical protein CO667_26555 [Rhizobium sp. L43]